MISIVNKHTHTPTPNDIYCGRGSPLGNPYSHLSNSKAKYIVESRDEAIEKYEPYLEEKIKNKDKEICDELNRIYKKVKDGEEVNLVCFCAPKKCHCESVKKKIMDKIKINSIST